ncbi:TPA: hypothetical protein DDZ86_05090 [Candidatus Dependentiae bacterium]|nr:MAG: hypothetical protein A2Y17_09895 [Clostridiales bacterium GWF2_38_85]HBL98987.1 hypothetical protein [Candidatus Dependentiae bacterium]
MKIKLLPFLLGSILVLLSQLSDARSMGNLDNARPVLGYSPHVIFNDSPDKIDCVIIHAHGFGSYDSSYESFLNGELKTTSIQQNYNTLNAFDNLFFNFRDHGLHYPHPYFALQHKLSFEHIPLHRSWYSNLGQDADALALLYFITLCYDMGYKTICGMGHSRGGAVWIRVLDSLTQPQKYAHLWKKLTGYYTKNGLEIARINAVRQAVENGFIVLMRPLIDTKSAFQNRIPCESSLPHFIARSLSWGLALGSSFICHYNPFAQEGYQILEELSCKGLLKNFNLSIYFSTQDENTGTLQDHKVVALTASNPHLHATIAPEPHCDHCTLSANETSSIMTQLNDTIVSHIIAPEKPDTRPLTNNLKATPAQRGPMTFIQDATLNLPHFIMETIRDRYIKISITSSIMGLLTAFILYKKGRLPQVKAFFNTASKRLFRK